MKAITEIQLNNYEKIKSGKVREIYKYGEYLLFVATDRISAYDIVFNEGIPEKGIFLTQISNKWFSLIDFVDNHILIDKWEEFPDELRKYEILKGRSIIVKPAEVIPFECVVRGYLVGSAWEEYKREGSVCNIKLPKGMKFGEKIDPPIFTPATKLEKGHDINVSYEYMANQIGKDIAEKLQKISIKIYNYGYKLLKEKGIILVDTKFEFGIIDGQIALIDEVLTPDSSRFWKEGKEGESIDKQYIRDYLNKINWNREPPPPKLPENIIKATYERYKEIYKTVKNLGK